ncbi:hypothetical protein D0817_23705 [Flavobacterium cupreum]|uniref:Uncharacterized protein n=2 Tax=Flavobacterium TaxID=237 RepID=A0A4Y7U5F7_9FLAO|nr:hypothetical protein [Flavobacterium]RUT67942.1 hypothetical protein D0817_23705 [Flavobacterium cupreum]TEB41022.1 hypothetical protein D0809_27640 [Flavobacterium circumlabens]
MINENQKDTIIAVLGKQYSPKIIEYLNKKKICNSNGNPFSSASIQKIVSGIQKNDIVELQIVNLVTAVKKRNEKTAKKLQTLL